MRDLPENTAVLLNRAGKELNLICYPGYNYMLDGKFISYHQLTGFVRNGVYKVVADNTYIEWPKPEREFKLSLLRSKTMDLNALLTRSIAIAADVHATQLDKAGQPYILHPLRVMMAVTSIEEKIVAVLHDVIEDSDTALEELSQSGYPSNIVTALDCITRREHETYDAFIQRVVTNKLASRVKVEDLKDNMNVFRLSSMTIKDTSRIVKYNKALQLILKEYGWAIQPWS